MSPPPDVLQAIRRILLALDSSTPRPEMLDQAVRLARRLNAELNALFIEDVNLLNLTELPFVRHTNLFSRVAEPVDRAAMESRLRVQATRARRALETAALQAGLRWTFRTVRGRVIDEVIAAATEQDLLLVGWTRRATDPSYLAGVRWHRRESGASSTARIIAVGSKRPVLVLRNGDILGHPVAVVFDGSPGAQRALQVAAALAGIARAKLVVLLSGDTALAELAAAILQDAPAAEVEYRVLRSTDVATVCAARAATGSGVVVLDAESPLLASGNGSPIAAFPCPVLLTR
jgi:nucleotide-binding universal stress UspA family protein